MAGFNKDNLKQIVSLVVFVCVTVAAHADVLPQEVKFLKPWIEFVGFIGTAASAWLVTPGRDEWTSEQRSAKRMEIRAEEQQVKAESLKKQADESAKQRRASDEDDAA